MKRFNEYFSEKISRYFSFITITLTLLAALILYLTNGYMDKNLVNSDAKVWSQTLQKDFNLIEGEVKHLLEDFDDSGDMQAFNTEIYRLRQNSHIKFNFTLLNESYEIVSTSLYTLNQMQFLKGRNLSELRYNPNFKVVIEQNYNDYFENQKAVMFIAIKGIRHILVLEHLEVSFVDLSQRQHSMLYLYDRYHNLIFHESMKYQNEIGKFKPSDNMVLTTNEVKLYDNSLFVSAIVDISSKQQLLVNSVIMIMIVMVAILGLIPFAVTRLMKPLNTPIVHLLDVIHHNQSGKFDIVEGKQEFVEFDAIVESFNKLMNNLEQTLQSNQELLERKRFMEIKQLQDQFNPHFLFNVLESIRYEIHFNPENGAEMIAALARLMRYMITIAQSEVSIEEDIKYLNDYLNLQGMRYKNRLDYHVDIEDSLKKVLIPKFILQPLVENSIKHNMERIEHLTIGVIGRVVGSNIEFDVVDDGVGINDEELRKIKNSLAYGGSKSFGLYNVHRTIQLVYGEQYGVFIENVGKGLHVKIRIPYGGNNEGNHR